MTLMPAATSAMVFRALRGQPMIDLGFDMFFDHVEKTRPSGATVIFLLRRKQLKPAPSAYKPPWAMLIQQRAGEWRFRTFFAQHIKLFFGQHMFPLLYAAIDFFNQFGCHGNSKRIKAEEKQNAGAT
jgi:hypothetical protein